MLSSVASDLIFRSCWRGRRPQPVDQHQDFLGHLSWYRRLGHLEGSDDGSAVAGIARVRMKLPRLIVGMAIAGLGFRCGYGLGWLIEPARSTINLWLQADRYARWGIRGRSIPTTSTASRISIISFPATGHRCVVGQGIARLGGCYVPRVGRPPLWSPMSHRPSAWDRCRVPYLQRGGATCRATVGDR